MVRRSKARLTPDALFAASGGRKHEVIAERIAELIRDRGMKPGDRIPSEARLTEAFGVAPATVRRGLSLLEQRGLLRREPKRGTFYTGSGSTRPDVPVPGKAEFPPQSPEGSPVPSLLSRRVRTVSFWAKELADPACRARWERLARGAESAMGDTRVALLPASAPTAADVARRACPDVMLVTAGELEGMESAGLLLPLGPNGPMSWFTPEDYFRVAQNVAVTAGVLRAVPFYVSASLKLWNSRLVDAACQGVPARATAGALQRQIAALDARLGPRVAAGTFVHLPYFQWLVDGLPIWDPASGAFALDLPEVRESLAFQRDMFRRLFAGAGTAEALLDAHTVWRSFSAGDLLVMDTFSYVLGHMPGPPRFPMRVQAPPLIGGCAVAAQVSVLGVSVTCAERERALDFIRFACGEAGQTALAESLHNVPALRRVAWSPAYLGRCPTGMAELLTALDAERSVFQACPLVQGDAPLAHKAMDVTLAFYEDRLGLDETLQALGAIGRMLLDTTRRHKA